MRELLILCRIGLVCVGGVASGVLAGPAASDYSRTIRMDWQPIAGARKYDVEWVRAPVCRERQIKAARAEFESETTTQPQWTQKLEAGHYCVRVRGVGAGGREGQWTDFQEMVVNPKPPAKVGRSREADLVWDKVPYATAYEVEVRGVRDQVVFTQRVSENSITFPNGLFQNSKLIDKDFSVNIRTVVSGLPPSMPLIQFYEFEKGGGSPFRARTDVPQPAVQDVVVVPQEAVERFVIAGEIPIAPTQKEWAEAKTPAQKEILKQRTIASGRVELFEQLEQTHPPDLRVKTGLIVGPVYVQNQGFPGGSNDPRDEDIHSISPAFQLGVDYNLKKPWGAYLRYQRRSITSSFGVSGDSTQFGVGIASHLRLDPYWQSVFSVEIGPELFQTPVFSDGDQGGYAIFMTAIGVRLGLQHRVELSDHWRLTHDVILRGAPSQSLLGETASGTYRVSFVGAQGDSSLTYIVNRSFEIEAGIRIGVLSGSIGSTASHDSYELGAGLNAAYRFSPAERRDPAAIRTARYDELNLWEIYMGAPLLLRDRVTTTFSGAVPKTESEFTPGGSLWVMRKFSQDLPWIIGLGGDARAEHFRIHWNSGVQSRLLRRPDLQGRLTLGTSWQYEQSEPASAPGTSIRLYTHSIDLGASIEKVWDKLLRSRLETEIRIPLFTYYGPDTTKAGSSLIWNVGVSSGVALTGALSAWGGYRYERLRLSAMSKDSASSGTWIDDTQHRFDLGLRVSW